MAVIKKQYLKLYRGSHFPLSQWYTIDVLVLYQGAIAASDPKSLAKYLNDNVDTDEFEKLNIATFTDFEAGAGYPHGELIDDPAYPDSQYIYVMSGDNNNCTNGDPYLGPNKEDGRVSTGNTAYVVFNNTPTQKQSTVYNLPDSQRPNLTGQYTSISKNYIDLTNRDAYTVKSFYCIISTTYSTTNRQYHLFRAAYDRGEFLVATYSKIISGLQFDNIITDNNERPFAPVVTDPYAPVKPSAPNGGNGNYGYGETYFQSGTLIPNGSAETDDSSTGLYTRYAVSIPILQSVGDWLWAESLGLQVAKTLVSLLYGDPIQTIISCVSYPFGLDSVGLSSTTLKWGGHDTGVSISCLNKSSYQIDWGTITVSEYWGNFLDYSPHTKMQLFLPWGTGFVDIDPNDIMRAKPTAGTDSSAPIEIGANGTGTISVITNIEFSRGICVHHVVANRAGGFGGTIIGTYSGSCGRQIPITGSDYASKQVAVAGSAIAAMVTGALAGGQAIKDRESMTIINNPNGMFKARSAEPRLTKVDAKGKHHDPITGKYTKAPMPEQRYDFRRGEVNTDKIKNIVAKGSKPAIASAASVLVSPPHVTRSGSFQEGSGGLTPQAPYLLISRPRVNIPSEYGEHYGYPSNINLNLQFVKGYTEIAEIHLDNIPATVEEIFELDDLLKGGVIL